jgi:hypothetical protein
MKRSADKMEIVQNVVPAPVKAPKVDASPAELKIRNQESLEKVPVRQNLNETAFFYPDLKTDAKEMSILNSLLRKH